MVKSASDIVFRKNELRKLKFKAIRHGIWFRSLSRIDRAIVDLTIKVSRGVRSSTLAKILYAVVRKVENTLENRFLQALKKFGFPRARMASFLAQKWGNAFARNWAYDISFAKFLAIMHINNSVPLRL